MPPFGVDLPDNLGESTAAPDSSSTSPDTGGAPVSTEKTAGTGTADGKPSITDLDKLDRFRFEGREWSRKELRDAYLRREDYSRKTAELAETRKYADNFAADLRTVIKDRARFAEFQRLYPREFVERAQEVMANLREAGGTEQTKPNDPNGERIQALEGKIQTYEQRQEAQEIEKLQLWIDNQFATFSKKYPDARQKEVMGDAEILARQGTKITPQVLEKLFKASHGEINGAWEARYKEKTSKQINAGKEGRDVGPGGGTPGEAPKTPKTFKEARELMIQDLQAGQRR